MSNGRNEHSSLLPTTEHTHYQSIGPSEPEQVSPATHSPFTFEINVSLA
jgi:hypothetical protein